MRRSSFYRPTLRAGREAATSSFVFPLVGAIEPRIMLQSDMGTGAHPHEIAASPTVAAWLATRGITARRGWEAVAPDTRSAKQAAPKRKPKRSSAAGKKWRRRRPLRMTPKAQRRRWFRQHNKRTRVLPAADARGQRAARYQTEPSQLIVQCLSSSGCAAELESRIPACATAPATSGVGQHQ